jgi:Flp pilus assembly protein TadB
MTGYLLLAGGFLAAAVLVAAPIRPSRSRGRLAKITPARVERGLAADREGAGWGADGHQAGATTSRPGRAPRGVDRTRVAAGLGAVAVALLVGGWWGPLIGGAAGIGLDRALRRLEPPGERARRQREAAELPIAADLLAVTLRGGSPVAQAVSAVADALPGPLSNRLARVARLLRLGAPPAEAWEELDPVAGAGRLVRAAVRSAEHGSVLSTALLGLADDLRAERAVAAEAAARRAAVLIVLPLGLCFLPAFILAGLVPVIIAVLGDVL